MKVLEHLKNEAKTNDADVASAPQKKARRAGKFIEPLAMNFKRSKKGDKLVQQEVKRLLDKQKSLFATKPMWNAGVSEVRYTDNGETKSISTKMLMLQAPLFFSLFFSSIRQKLLFGTKVQQWLVDVFWISSLVRF